MRTQTKNVRAYQVSTDLTITPSLNQREVATEFCNANGLKTASLDDSPKRSEYHLHAVRDRFLGVVVLIAVRNNF